MFIENAFQPASLRPSIATGLRELAFSDTTGKASANDGDGLVALASLCGDVNLRDVGDADPAEGSETRIHCRLARALGPVKVTG